MASLKELNDDQLQELVTSCGGEKFRARQLWKWLWAPAFAASWEEMKNLPRRLVEALAQKCRPFSLEVIGEQRAVEDGTVKWLSRLEDGNTIETVLITTPKRTTVCISTQVGCAVRCVFCASGRQGLIRNLTMAEIADQVVLACRGNGFKRVDNIVVMGMGEPLMNLPALVAALDLLGREDTLGLGARHVTISTSGIVPGILELAAMERSWNLALSLHAVDDASRRQIIPDAHRYPLEEIFAACGEFRGRTNRMITLEYALLAGQNDSSAALEKLAVIARRLRAKVNLIPCNPAGSRYQAPPVGRCREWVAGLTARGVQATLRLSRGGSIQAACGQLRRANQEAKED